MQPLAVDMATSEFAAIFRGEFSAVSMMFDFGESLQSINGVFRS